MDVALPAQVRVLDIETEKAIRGEVSKTPLTFAGVKVYNLHGGRYHPCKQRIFLPDNIGELETLLRDVNGIVLGHNILRFDYAVLGSHISLEGIEVKTVDTFLFMYEKVSTGSPESGILENWSPDPGLGYFSLDNLAKLNFDEGKTISGKGVPKLWREGHRQTVIDYNEKDLSLTYRVWRRLVEGEEVLLRESPERSVFGVEAVPEKVETSGTDRLRLTGQRPLFNTRQVLVTDGPEMEIPPPNDELGESKWS